MIDVRFPKLLSFVLLIMNLVDALNIYQINPVMSFMKRVNMFLFLFFFLELEEKVRFSMEKNISCFFQADNRWHPAGTEWYPYLHPFGYSACAVCSCLVSDVFFFVRIDAIIYGIKLSVFVRMYRFIAYGKRNVDFFLSVCIFLVLVVILFS